MQARLFTGQYKHKPARAIVKLICLALAAVGMFFVCLQWVDDDALTMLKHNLTAPTILALVVIINLISLVLFLIIYAAWQWVRRDLKPPRPEQIYSESDKS